MTADVTALPGDTLQNDIASLASVLPALEGTGSRSATVEIAMLRRMYDALLETPQVYINEGEDGGGYAEATVTRGQVDVIHVNWNEVNERAEVVERELRLINPPDPDDVEYLTEARKGLERVADPEYRGRLLEDFDTEMLAHDIDLASIEEAYDA